MRENLRSILILYKMINYRKTVIICLINKDKEILLHLRDDKPEISYPNYWGLVGGVVDGVENEEDAIKREMKEEIGYEAKNINFIGKIYALKNNLIKHNDEVFIFKGLINIPANLIHLTEGQKVQFFKFDEIEKLKIIEPIKKFIIHNKERIFIYK